MTSEQTQDILDQFAEVRRRIDELRDAWEAHPDVASVVRPLMSCQLAQQRVPRSRRCSLGAARLIERDEPAARRLEKLSDHLHGYMVGWEDAAQARAS